MSTLLIGYDLNSPGQDYSALVEAIKKLGSAWWHHLDSTWLVRTSMSPGEVRDELKQYLDSSDELLVIDITSDSMAWTGFNERGRAWLKATS
jgi:hypothetical protein